LQQFALKTNDNFGFFFGMMHRPDTSIRGAWNAAGDDSECYNRTGSPIFEFFKAISNSPLDNSRKTPFSKSQQQLRSKLPCSLYPWAATIPGLGLLSKYAYRQPWRAIQAGLLWMLAGRGIGSSNHFEVGGFIRSKDGVPHPDLQYHFIPGIVTGSRSALFLGPVICCGSNDAVIVSSV